MTSFIEIAEDLRFFNCGLSKAGMASWMWGAYVGGLPPLASAPWN